MRHYVLNDTPAPLPFYALLVLMLVSTFSHSQIVDRLNQIGGSGVSEVSWIEIMGTNEIWIGGNYLADDQVGPFELSHKGALDIFVALADSNLAISKLVSFQSSSDDFVEDAIFTNGRLYICGTFWDSLFFQQTMVATAQGKAIFLAGVSDAGELLSLRIVEGNGIKQVSAIHSAGGDILMVGYFGNRLFTSLDTLTATSGLDGFVLVYSAELDLLDQHSIACDGDLMLEDVAATERGIVIGGSFSGTVSFGQDTYETRTSDSDGWLGFLRHDLQEEWAMQNGGVFTDKVVALSSIGDTIYAAGHFMGVNGIEGGLELQSAGFETDLFVFGLTDRGEVWGGSKYGGRGAERLHNLKVEGSEILMEGMYDGVFIFGSDTISNSGLQETHAFFASLDKDLQTGHLLYDLGAGSSSSKGHANNAGQYYGAGFFQEEIDLGGLQLTADQGFNAFMCRYRKDSDLPQDPDNREVLLFPNPVREFLHIKIDELPELVEVFDSVGRSYFVNWKDNRFFVGHLPSGLYYCRITIKKGDSRAASFIKL